MGKNLSARKHLSRPTQYSRLTLYKMGDSISEVRLNLLVPCIGPSRRHRADRRGGERRPVEPDEEVSFRPLQRENPQDGDGVAALKVVAYFDWPESSSPETGQK
ncbi:MAG: hypothetical protein ACE5JO_08950 [Candidatus Binatia bacterium]